REVLRRRVRVEITEREDAVARVVHCADALRIACRHGIDMPGGAAHVGLERPEVRAPAQPFGALDRVGLDQQREVEARPMELVAALAQERRVAERWDEDGLKGRRCQDAWISCDASAPARGVLAS